MEHTLENFIEWAFGLSLFINAALFLPQAFILFKKKDASEISLLTFLGFLIMQALAVAHGFIVNDYLLAFGFSLSFITCFIVAFLAVYYRVRVRHV